MKRFMSSAAVVLLLAGCGGGGDGPAPIADPTAGVPGSAAQSSAGMLDYLRALVGADAEGKEPVSLDGYTPPTSDDTEPEAV